jgi:LysR family glycine cleavage system transcriptional activator
MTWPDLPPLNGLRAFAVVAETGSYSKAGARLHVTHAAVSQQVRLLEARLGVPLVVREGRGIRITSEGLQLARSLDAGFSMIQEGLAKLDKANDSFPVQLSTSPAFAVEWLMPRIQDFQSRYPKIPLMINPTSTIVELNPGSVEVAIRYGDRRSITSSVTPILVSDMVVVAAPSLVGETRVRGPADLLQMPWLQELGTNEVADWFACRDVRIDRPLMISQMPGNLIMQAVRRGDGITYTARAFFEKDIEAGRIKVLFSDAGFGIYHLLTCRGPLRHSVQTFIGWLKEQVETTPAQ